jgi:uncharacterized membrane protein YbhN (UPF0104 family)
MPRSPRRWARWVTRGALVLGLAALVWTIHRVGPAEIAARLLIVGPWFVPIVALELFMTVCDGAAIYLYLSPHHRRVGLGRALIAQVTGRAVNAVTPLGSAGEVVKVAMLVDRAPRAPTVAAILLYNLANLELSLVLIAVGAPLIGLGVAGLPRSLAAALVLAGVVTAAGAITLRILVRRRIFSSLVRLLRALRFLGHARAERWKVKLRELDETLRAGDAQGVHRLLAYTCIIVSRAGSWATIALLIHAAGGEVSVVFLVAFITAYQVIVVVSAIVPMGVGLVEGGSYAMFRALGADPAIGVTVALGKRVTQLLFAGVGLVLGSVNQTVKEARARAAGQRAAGGPEPGVGPSAAGTATSATPPRG